MALSSRLAIIAGGVGGLGSATGKLLRSQGAKLALLYAPFEKDKVEPTISQVYGPNATDVKTYECDITSQVSVDSAFAAIERNEDVNSAAFPTILINAAGYISLAPLEDFDAKDIRKHYDVNLFGPTLTGSAFARLYTRAADQARKEGKPVPGGRIINIASQAAHVALHNHGPYCASKAGLLGLTRCQASEWGPRGITSNSISPGPVWTDLGKKAWGDDAVREKYLEGVPTGKLAEPEEVAETIAFLCSDGAVNINGNDIRLEGGYTSR